MSIQAVREYVALLWGKYQGASRRFKSQILDEIERNLGVHRKAAVRLMNSPQEPRLRRGKGSPRNAYSDKARELLRRLWKDVGYLGAKRLHAVIPEWLPYWQHPSLDDYTAHELKLMSPSTVERILRPDKANLRRRMNTGTQRSGSRMKTVIPIRDLEFEPTEPGHCEIDCVAHCGGSMSGDFAWTLTLTDIVSGCTVCRAIMAKNGFAVMLALREIERCLPFRLIALYMDNGTEFLNDQLYKLFANSEDRDKPIELYRSRPYKKNDQCFVEQKNFTHVREIFGYERISGKLMVQLMNGVYAKEWRLLSNHFLPQIRLESKERVGSKVIRRFKEPETPYAVLLRHLDGDSRLRLQAEHQALNPFELRRKLKQKLRDFQAYNSRPRDGLGRLAL